MPDPIIIRRKRGARISPSPSPEPPDSIAPTQILATSMTMSWDPVAGADNYVLERDTNSDFSTATEVFSGSGTSYNNTGLTDDTLYYWRVKAQTGEQESGYTSTSERTFITQFAAVVQEAIDNTITRPSLAIQRLLNTHHKEAVASGFIAKRLRYYVFLNAHLTPDFGRIDWISPAANPRAELSALVGSWAGTASVLGFKPDGSDSYIDTNFNPSTDGGVMYTINSAGINLDCSTYTGNELNALGLRSATAQIAIVPKANDNNSKYIIHDNTSANQANTHDRGLYFMERTSATAKIGWRRRSIGNFTQNSVEIPNGTILLGARRRVDTATVDNFYDGIISNFGIGAPLTANEKVAYQNSWIKVKLSIDAGVVIASEIPGVKILYRNSGVGATWDETTLFGHAHYEDESVNFDLFSASNDPDAGDPDDYSVGAFDYSGDYTGSKDGNNPLIDIAGLSPWTSVIMMDALVIGSTIRWFASIRDGSGNTDTATFTSTVGDEKNFSALTVILNAGTSGQRFNHGLRIIRDHPDTDYWYATYSFRNTSADPLRINVARCLRSADLSNPANWSVVHSNVLATPFTSNIGQVYAWCWYVAGQARPYKMLYAGFAPEQQDDALSIFSTDTTDISAWPPGKETLWPTGVSGDVDSQYTSLPYLDFERMLIHYATRDGGGNTPYLAHCVKSFVVNY